MLVGFTGTQKGMTEYQFMTLVDLLQEDEFKVIEEFHHGDCIGADHLAVSLIACLHRESAIVCHPPILKAKRAFVESDVTWPEKDYLARNHDIVNACDVLIACPKGTKEELRSGTWATVRYARSVDKRIIMIYPKERNE